MNSIAQTQPRIKTAIRYSRIQKTWQTVNGTVNSYGPGPAGKLAATWAALVHDHPRLYKVIRDQAHYHHGDLPTTEICFEAAKKLAKGLVYKGGIVASGFGGGLAKVSFDGYPHKYECSCNKKRTYSLLYGPMCVDAWAVHLAYLAGIELPLPPLSEAIPFNGEPVPFDDDLGYNELDYDVAQEIDF
jgi:hypothetical protein